MEGGEDVAVGKEGIRQVSTTSSMIEVYHKE